jgi:hypothetical protein
MTKQPAGTPRAGQMDDDQVVSEELTGRLYGATEDMVRAIVAGLSLEQRANLAMFCYRKAHLHRTGLVIAATCDRSTLIGAWGTVLGQTLFDQSQEPAPRLPAARGRLRAEITLGGMPAFAPRLAASTVEDVIDLVA